MLYKDYITNFGYITGYITYKNHLSERSMHHSPRALSLCRSLKLTPNITCMTLLVDLRSSQSNRAASKE